MTKLSQNEGWFLLGATLLAAALRYYKIDAVSLWLDELTTYSTTQVRPFSAFFKFYFKSDNTPPLYALLSYPFTFILPQTEMGVRFSAALFGTLCVPAIYFLGRLFSKKTAMLAAVFMTISYLGIYFSQEARTYSLMILLCIITSYYWMKICFHKHGKIDLVLYALSSVALFYSHYYGILFLGTQGLLACVYGPRIGWKNLIFVCAAIVLLSSPWFPTLLEAMAPKVYTIGRPRWVDLLGYHRYLYEKTAVLSIAGTGLILAALRMKWRAGGFKNIEKETMLILFGLLPFIFAFIRSRYVAPMLYERCMLIALPSVMVVTAMAVDEVSRRGKNVNRFFVCIATFLVLVGLHNTFIRAGVYSLSNKDLNREAYEIAEELKAKYSLPLVILGKNRAIITYYLKPETQFVEVPYMAEVDVPEHLSKIESGDLIYFSFTVDITEEKLIAQLERFYEIVERRYTRRSNYLYVLRRKTQS